MPGSNSGESSANTSANDPLKIISLDNLSTYTGLIAQNYEPKTVIISYDDYVALPEAQKLNGTIYFVPDAPSSGGLGDSIFALSATLTAGQTSLTFTDSRLTANTILDFFYSTDGVSYETFTQNSATSFTLTFEAQASDLVVKVIAYNI